MATTPAKLNHAAKLSSVILARISQESVRQGDSLEHQVMALTEWARRLSNDEVQYVINYIFKDDGESAWSQSILERPAMQKLIEVVERGEAKVVFIKGLSRFNRDDAEARMFFEWLDGKRVRLLSLEEGFDSAERGSAMAIFMVHSFVSRMESDRKSVSIKVAMRQKAQKGEFKGGLPPYGYEYNPTTKKLQPIERLIPVVQDIFEMAAQGWGANRIAHELNKTKKWAHVDDREWTHNLVKRMLSRRTYIGDLVQCVHDYRYTRTLDRTVNGGRAFGKKKRILELRRPDEAVVIENAHQGIISRQLFEAVQHQIKARAKPDHRPYQPNAKYPLTGVLVCGSCGGPMIHHGRNKGRGYNYYTCSIKFRKGMAFCNQENVRADTLHELVLLHLEERLEQLRNDNEFWERFRANEGSSAALARSLTEIEGKIRSAEDKLAQMFIDADDIRSSVFQRASRAIEQKIADLERQRDQIKAQLQEAKAGKETANSLIADIDELFRRGFHYDPEDRAGLRALFQKWVHKITLYNDGHGGGYKGRGRKKHVEIEWKVDQMLKEPSN